VIPAGRARIGIANTILITMRRMRRISTVAAVLALGLLTGCQQALFPADSQRTQFDHHNRVRGRVIPLTEPDVFGNPQPALRARLSQNY
jgi:hypothetical protein